MARFLPIPDPAGSLQPPRLPPPTALATATPDPEPHRALDEAAYLVALRRCSELLQRLEAFRNQNPFLRVGQQLKALARRAAALSVRHRSFR